MTAKVIICLNGCAPDYLAGSETPNLDAIAREGFHTIGSAVVPTVTNVNNTSIITASLPERHGITLLSGMPWRSSGRKRESRPY